MKEGKLYEFDPQVYPRRVWVVIGGDEEWIRALFCQNDGKELNFQEAYKYSATTTAVSSKESNSFFGELIWFPKRSDIRWDYIAHEATHCAMDIFGDMGITPDVNNQEPLAYLVGWVVECIEKIKRGKV